MAANPPASINYAGVILPNSDGSFDSNYPNGDKPIGNWELGAGNYVPTKLSLAIVYPRPDVETQTHARHRVYHSDMPYEISVGVQGGAWPYKFEIISAPTGATIHQFDAGDAQTNINNGYGLLKWTPSGETTTQTFTVRITDQDLNTIDVTWTADLDDSAFIFIQDGWTGTKTGTKAEPLATWADWYKGDNSDATYQNKIIVFRGGNYTAVGDATNNNGNAPLNSNKTPSIIGYPGETPVIDCSSCKILPNGLDDLTIHGIRWENARTDVANAHFFWVLGVFNRVCFSNNYFYNCGAGTSGADNANPIFVSDTTTEKLYQLYRHNTFDAINNGGGGNGGYIDLYGTSNFMMEENIAKNSNNGHGFWPKSTKQNGTIRANEAWDNVTNGGVTLGYSDASVVSLVPHDHEICWNRCVAATGNALPTVFECITDNGYSTHAGTYIFRNSFVNASSWVRFVGAENYKTDGNVIVSNNLNRWDTAIMDTAIANVTGSESDGVTDANGLLQGTYRTNNLNKAGAERSYE